ncbi:Lrp/AsnC ligand binding domain-containing protein [Bacteriovoracaceae bacterium]|nr:Lrp/AsnC ligand binding domain-containing protein [Bacteriovoracaceae bacterium]
MYEFDKVDRDILNKLLEDSRRPFQDIARELVVSGGTIHVRVNKMKEAGILKGSRAIVDFNKLGLEVVAFVGVNLVSAGVYPIALEKLKKFSQITEVHYTTGTYSMFVKVVAESTRELHLFLIEKLQSIPEIQSTETLISLDNPLLRDPEIPEPKE